MSIVKKLVITREELKKHFNYFCDSGEFVRISRRGGGGSIDKYGYLILKIKSKQYKAHRMAWLFHYGVMPSGNIDHINGNKTDNRICNLRDVSQADNCRNANVAVNKETGVKGVRIDRTKGLKKKYCTAFKGVTYRFYTVSEAVSFRNKKLTEAGYGKGHF